MGNLGLRLTNGASIVTFGQLLAAQKAESQGKTSESTKSETELSSAATEALRTEVREIVQKKVVEAVRPWDLTQVHQHKYLMKNSGKQLFLSQLLT